VESNELNKNGPDTSGYEDIFGKPFWESTGNQYVHAFVTHSIVREGKIELQVELVLHNESLLRELATIAELKEDRQRLFEFLDTSFAIIESNVQGAHKLFGKDTVESLEGSWRSFTLTAKPSGEQNNIRLLSTLADPEGTLFGIASSKPTPAYVVKSIHGNLGQVAKEADIKKVLKRFSRLHLKLAVLDVGQAAASFLFSRDIFPEVYFDLGGPIWKNARTFPSGGVQWCFSQHPPVILSHWHWDHWAGATYEGGINVAKAMKTMWICPDQPTGAQTKKFQAKILAGGGSILLWSDALPPIRYGPISLGRATGKAYNDTGLVLLVESPGGRFSLLPGDAAYNNIPGVIASIYKSCGLGALVISHHGGSGPVAGVPPYPIPPPDLQGANVAVYSAGDGNTYGHPDLAMVADHSKANWKVVGTDSRKVRNPARHLYAHTGGLNGVVMSPACGGSICSLSLHK
jgi:hypothetical protein